MKNKILVVGLITLLSLSFMGAIVTVTGIGNAISIGTGTYAQGQVDTVKWYREKGVVGAAFGISVTDSSNIQNIIVKRVVNGKIVSMPATAVADTIAGAAASGVVPVSADSSADAASYVHTFTLTPYADEYWFFVKYATGVTYQNAVDTATVRYEIIKQYNN
jgi:hypothetical protein